MGDCVAVLQLLDKLHNFVGELGIQGREDDRSLDEFFCAYNRDTSVDWKGKIWTMRAIKFVKTLAICFYCADWSVDDVDAGESLYSQIKTNFRWMEMLLTTADDISSHRRVIAHLYKVAVRVYGEPAKLPVFVDGVALDKFAHSVRQYVIDVPEKPFHHSYAERKPSLLTLNHYSSVEANYRLTLKQLEYFTYILSNSGSLEKKLQSRAGALICSILHLANSIHVRVTHTAEMEEHVFGGSFDMALKLSPCHNLEAMELCIEHLSAKAETCRELVESFHNLLRSAAQNQVPNPMMHRAFSKDLNRSLFSLVDHSNAVHKLNLIKAELFVMATFHENQAATFGEALTFFNTSAGNMEDQENVLLQVNVHFLKEAARELCESGRDRVSEAMIRHSSLEIFKLYKQEFFFTVSRRFKSQADFDAPVEKRSFISFRELLNDTCPLSSKIELNLEGITAVYEQGSSSLFGEFIKSGRGFSGDHLMAKMRKLLVNKPHTFSLMKDQIVTLLGELEFLGSLLKQVKMEDVGVRVMCVIFEAEYILDMFLQGEAPAWYQQLLILNAIQETKLIKAKISEYRPDKTSDDQAEIIVDMLQTIPKDLDTSYYFLNGFDDEGAKEYWRDYIQNTYLRNSSAHWTDKKSTMRATSFLKTIQFFYNTHMSITDEDKQLVELCQRRENYFRWLQNEIHERGDPFHLASALSESFISIGLFGVEFKDVCNQLMKIPHSDLFVGGVGFDELSDSVQQFLMLRGYKVSGQMLERLKCSVIGFSKYCSDPKSLQSLLAPAVTMVFSILHMARRFEIYSKEENIFPSSFELSRRVLPQDRGALEVYVEVLSANVGIIKATKQSSQPVHATESDSFLNILQSAKNQAQIIGEIIEFPAMDLIADDHMDILLKQGYMAVAREAASLFSSGHPSDHNALTNLLNKLHLIKGEVFVFEVECQKARLTSFGGNRASTTREAFRFLNEFFKMPEANMAEEEKVYLELIQSLLSEMGSFCELSVDEILESSLAVYKLFKAEALFMVLRHSSSSFNIISGFRSGTIQKIVLFLRELASGTPNANMKDAIEETEDLYMRDLWLLYNNFPRSDGTFVAQHIVKKLRKCGTNLPDSMVFMKESFQSLLEMLELFILFLNETSNRSLELRVTFYIYAVEYIVDMMLMLGDGSLGYRQLVFFIAIEEAEFIKANIMEHFHDKKESIELPLGDIQLCSEPETSEIRDQETTIEEVIDVFGDQVQSIAAQLKTGKPLQVVSLVGMAGIGKTTLAKKVYGSQVISQHFDVRAFCCISQVYQKREVLLDILGGFVEVTDDLKRKDANGLEEEVKKNLSGKRYLIIVDDIWSAQHFDDLKLSFPNNNKGSKILVTTREGKLAEKLNKRGVHQVPLLETPDSWKLLQEMLFREEKCPKELVEVGWLIAENCRGLPLAIAVVSGILKKKDRVKDQWEEIAKHLKSFIAEDKASHFMDILEFSYNHLPSYLKPCYLYLASFLEDQEIPVKKLYWLWISEGFIPQSSEETAEGYLLELMNRSLVIEAKRNSMGGAKTCRIHDMLRDLCLKKAKENNFMQLMSVNDSDSSDAHISVQYRVCVHSRKKNFILLKPSPSHVHSLLYFATNSTEDKALYDISCIYENLRLLRVLDLESIASKIISYTLEINWMLGLNYLAIKGTIKYVPSSIANLWNLETLIVKGMRGEVVLPSSIWSMVTLRNVHIRPQASVTLESPELENAIELENLTTFSRPAFSSEEQTEMILRRWISLKKLRCMFQEGTMLAALRLLIQLESLNLYYIGKQVPYHFSFPANLKKLTLSRFSWAWKHMHTISALHNLEVLKLLFRSFVGDTWDMEEGDFPKLKFFKLENLNLAKWTASSGNFPRLERLVLRNCKKLVVIPSEFESIYTLEMVEVYWCTQSCANSVQPIFQKLVKSGNKNFGVMITPQEWDFRASS